ncbi:tat (twin-arginine translocation) pathway signal sequence domain protein [Ralstonia insidiosa]|uniref:Tat (Twin-arginine translocation) pathway signal sequence domain protein n=1 Tax=Ralstonia insidiosa TaxID=190721 RepID=A0AAC9FUP8_9RALS|nr:tat (twin-arginine translocation) pathway signal sequence domain protein [Ralstonia insidiosa]
MNAPREPLAPMPDAPSRRRFLQQSALLTAGLAVGFRLPDALAAGKDATAGEFEPNAWVRVLADNTVKIVVHKHDSGTGTQTALAACVAEELDVDPMRIAVITPEDPFFQDYIHPIWKVYSTGGSTSVSLEYTRLRQAGATARAMLVSAAAQRWGVPVASCSTTDGTVICNADGRKATYGELADAAGRLPAPTNVALKNPADFKYIGKLRHKRDALAKATGRFHYGIDVALPGMLVAVVQRAPMPGARVRHIDSAETLKVRGVRQVITIPLRSDVLGGNQEGVAVLADDYWAANKGRAALKVEWDDSAFADFDSGHVAAHQAAWLASGKARVVHTVQAGNTDAAIAHGAKRINAAYRMPYKQQNPLEPVNITAWLKDGTIQYWGGIQVPSTAMEAAETICGLPRDKVVLHEMVSGGSFGARESKYWLFEVSYLAKKAGVPVKLMNSREDEMRALYGHPATYHQLEGALDAQGRLDALRIRAVSPASPSSGSLATSTGPTAWTTAPPRPSRSGIFRTAPTTWTSAGCATKRASRRAGTGRSALSPTCSPPRALWTNWPRRPSAIRWNFALPIWLTAHAMWRCCAPPHSAPGGERLLTGTRWAWPRTRPMTATSPWWRRWRARMAAWWWRGSPAWRTSAWPSRAPAWKNSSMVA